MLKKANSLPISTEAAPPLSPTVFFLAVSQALSKSIRADCKKAWFPADTPIALESWSDQCFLCLL